MKKKSSFKLNILYEEAGAHCIPKYGTNLPKETLELIKQTNACLKGPMTTPEEPGAPVSVAVTLRRMFNLYAKVCPCKTFPNVESLKPNIDLVADLGGKATTSEIADVINRKDLVDNTFSFFYICISDCRFQL